MMNQIKKIKSFLGHYWINFRLQKAQAKIKEKKCVVFICQYEPAWLKIKGIVFELLRRKIKTVLYIVKDERTPIKNVTIFEKEQPDICVFHKKKLLRELCPSIVIYTRPYDFLLPREIRSFEVLKYSKTAFIPYFYGMKGDYSLCYSMFKRVNVFFADQQIAKKVFDRLQQKNVSRGLQKSFDLGFPIFESLYIDLPKSSFKNLNRFKVVWTPRWKEGTGMAGGSNFLKYYKDLFSFFYNNKEFDFLFRPHPFLFDNLISEGKITKTEKELLIKKIKDSDNIIFDNSSNYLGNFADSDLLISDFSSVVPEYFLLGKPIIYCCQPNEYNQLNKNIKEMIDCNYIANSFSDIIELLSTIRKYDPKREERTILSKRFFETQKMAAIRIANVLEKE